MGKMMTALRCAPKLPVYSLENQKIESVKSSPSHRLTRVTRGFEKHEGHKEHNGYKFHCAPKLPVAVDRKRKIRASISRQVL